MGAGWYQERVGRVSMRFGFHRKGMDFGSQSAAAPLSSDDARQMTPVDACFQGCLSDAPSFVFQDRC